MWAHEIIKIDIVERIYIHYQVDWSGRKWGANSHHITLNQQSGLLRKRSLSIIEKMMKQLFNPFSCYVESNNGEKFDRKGQNNPLAWCTINSKSS